MECYCLWMTLLEEKKRPQTKRGRQVADIVDALRHEIISGTLTQNVKLRQEQLADRFGVSRMPIREAFRVLEADGLVVFDPNKGVRVAPLTKQDLEEIYEMRISAECLALRTAIPHLTNAQLDKAETIQETIQGAKPEQYGMLNAQFHTVLYAPCARPRLLAHIDVLSGAADRYLCMTVAKIDYSGKSNDEHYQLLNACRARHVDSAIDCLTKHISEAGQALANLLNDHA